MNAIQYTLHPQRTLGTSIEQEVRIWTFDSYAPVSWDLTDSTLKIWDRGTIQLVAYNVQEARIISDYQPPATDTEGE